ncbi:unnamed protein product [Effrenium voratum]|nr:unnamed protein product [Effrenium voratum]
MKNGHEVTAGVFYGLAKPGPCPDQVLRAARLSDLIQESRKLAQFDGDDFRQLEPSRVIEALKEASEDAEKTSWLAAAIFVGTAQACLKGGYSMTSPPKQVDCGHLVRPISCLHPAGSMPSQSSLKASCQRQRIQCYCSSDALDVALQLSAEGRHVTILRCTASTHPRSERRKYSNLHEDQLFFRTTYFEGFERVEADIQAAPDTSLVEGGIIYTSGVGILRGALKDGAPWVEPAQVDVLWFTLPLHPHHGEQVVSVILACGCGSSSYKEIYAREEERNLVSAALDRAFAWACAHGADALVLPPFACQGGFLHPRLHFAGLVHEVSRLHERHLPSVCVASEHPSHDAAWWDGFADGVVNGRPVPPPIIHVPTIPLMTDKLVGKDASALLEKRRKQHAVWSLPGTRQFRTSFM